MLLLFWTNCYSLKNKICIITGITLNLQIILKSLQCWVFSFMNMLHIYILVFFQKTSEYLWKIFSYFKKFELYKVPICLSLDLFQGSYNCWLLLHEACSYMRQCNFLFVHLFLLKPVWDVSLQLKESWLIRVECQDLMMEHSRHIILKGETYIPC